MLILVNTKRDLPPIVTLSLTDFPATPGPGLGRPTVSILLKDLLIPSPAVFTVSDKVSSTYGIRVVIAI